MGEAYNPLKRFELDFKDSFARNASECFERMARESGVDPAENARLVGLYNEYTDKCQKAASLHSAYCWGIAFMSIVLIASCLTGAWALSGGQFQYEGECLAPMELLAICGVAALLSTLALAFWLVPGKGRAKALRDECNEKANEFRRQAEEQMSALNRLYTWDIAVRLMEKTLPDISFDRFSNEARMMQFHQEFGWNCQFGDDTSVLFTQTGELAGNPFAFCKLLYMYWGTETYSGSITIHWTTVERDSQGKRYTEHHSEVLTAYVTKPKPEYSETTMLVYANEAAPNLSFTRQCSGLAQKEDSFLGRLSISRTRKKLEEFSRNLQDESNYTMMANKDFETYFNTMDRDDEVEFRVMFTPMAQNSMMELLKDRSLGYGDNFCFNKDHKINIISAEHLNQTNLDTRPEQFFNFSLEDARRNFVSSTCEYFRSVYFALAPVLAIPVYMQTLPKSKLDAYPELALDSANSWECEATANYIGESRFAHPSSVTRNILKVGGSSRNGEQRRISVTAYGYRTVKHVERVSKWGGDGKLHSIPVTWLEYIQVSRRGEFSIKEDRRSAQANQTSSSRADFFRRNMFVFRGNA